MSADFWAGYASGAIGIAVGNPLDILKTKLQAGSVSKTPDTLPGTTSSSLPSTRTPYRWTAWFRGAAAPVLGYGALNALLFVTYNRSLALLSTGDLSQWPEKPSAWSLWTAGAVGGLATFFVSAPTELVKCRAQVCHPPQSSLDVARDLWTRAGIRGLYMGGGVTSVRDAVGYGFYFWSYELSKRVMTRENESHNQQALKVLLCGGLAGVVTWVSIFPLDVVKTRVQTWDLVSARRPTSSTINASQPLLSSETWTSRMPPLTDRPSAFMIAKRTYAAEGISAFFKGLGVCTARAFIVNAVQWAIYESLMKQLAA